MTFSSIIRKNFIYNLNKYISFYFVNSLIIAMLFMYGSLMFNPVVLNSVGKTSLYETIKIALLGIILFSIVFITYTNIAFLKNRGKEFGMYLTLGMTTKDLGRLILVENLGIMLTSLITGVLGGALFGRLFHMGLIKILKLSEVPYKLTYKSFLLSIGIFVLIFLCNVIFNLFYIKRTSIIDNIKSSKKKEVGKANIFLGILSLILLITALYCLPKALLKEIFKNQSYMIGVFIALTLICPYMIIGSIISITKELTSKFPKLYNRNILILSNLSHRFLAYKNILYMLSLLVAGAMFFVGISYSLYVASRESINADNPYDIMFVETDKYNKVQKEDVEKNLVQDKEKIKNYKVLEYIEVPSFHVDGNNLIFWSDNETVISETNYNRHMGTNVEVKENESIYATVYKEKMNYQPPSTILFTFNDAQLKEVKKLTWEQTNKNNSISKSAINTISGNAASLNLDKKNIRSEKGVAFANRMYNTAYYSGTALIVSDKNYEMLKSKISSSSIKKLHLLNVKNSDAVMDTLVNYLRKVNGLDNSYWKEGNLWGRASNVEAYRPIFKEELVRLKLQDNGMMFFTMMFVGVLFLIANGVVLYYKVLSDIDNEKERIASLTRIGITEKEMKSTSSKELAITFFTPLLIGGGLGLYYIYILCSNMSITALLIKNAFITLLCGAVLQTLFYLISRKKFIKTVLV